MTNSPVQQPILPKRRFPEFASAPPWEEKRLGDIAKFFKGKAISKADIDLNGKTPCIRYGELYTRYNEVIDVVYSKTNLSTSYLFFSQKNDVLMPTSDVTPRGLATACCIKLDGIVLGGDILVIRTDKKLINGEFLARYIRHLEHKVLQLVSGTIIFHLYESSINKLKLLIPSVMEQQRVADCLSALDDMIAAEKQSLASLQEHKKGLLSQLFPAAGETLPKFRFPEFASAPPWQEKPLGEVIKLVLPPMKIPTRRYNKTGIFPIIDQSQNKISGWTNDQDATVDKRLPLIIFGDHTCVLKIVNQPFAQGADGIKIFRGLSQIYTVFLYQALQFNPLRMEEYKRHFSILKERLVSFPKLEEQQKIADCLSVLDELIATQAQKIELLQEHKKGMMQQLFPTTQEVK